MAILATFDNFGQVLVNFDGEDVAGYTSSRNRNADDIDFLLDNQVHFNFIGIDRSLDVDMDWG